MQTILLVEDDHAITESLAQFLQNEGYLVVTAVGAREASQALSQERINLLLVDITLENGNGYEVCRAAKKLDLPVIFLTASDDELSTVRGLDMGADDYIPKPFRPRELVSRIRKVMRWYGDKQSKIQVGDLIVDTDKGTVEKAGEPLPLSALEYRLLSVFLNNRGRLLTRDALLDDIWDIAGDYVNDNTLTVYIKRLREKIETDPKNPQLIQTVRGLGYRMD